MIAMAQPTADRRRDISWSPGAVPRSRGAARLILLVVFALASAVALAATATWLSIAADGVHDPRSLAVGVLQEPREALGSLPPDSIGNQVRWMQALDQGDIQPRTNIQPETRVNLRTTEVLLRNTGEMPMVKFPHRQHTAWLDCSNCHDQLFAQVAGTTKINMFLVLQGEKCGLCHGAVAFPLTECLRCHSVQRGSPEHLEFGKSLVREGRVP
jgi:c(7)-type cytochrome triheme protein